MNPYDVMWMMVIFDLPVYSKKNRKDAHDFREYLLQEGFDMVQFSVYRKFVGGRKKSEAIFDRLAKKIPEFGKVEVLLITDKQFEAIRFFYNAKYENAPSKPEQLILF